MGEEVIEVYTDGGAISNPIGEAGWAYLTIVDGHKQLYADRMGTASNNAAEMEAVIQALSNVSREEFICIYSDSAYIVKTFTEGWKRRANLDRWEKLDQLLQNRSGSIRFRLVKGHAGNENNELVDLAVNYVLGRHLTSNQLRQLEEVWHQNGHIV